MLNIIFSFFIGFPIAVSYPHFYKADPALLEAVDGSYPDPEKHESQFLVQPVSTIKAIKYTLFNNCSYNLILI